MKLATWRSRHKRTQAWLAEATGIPQGLISKYERGQSVPQLRNVRRIEEATSNAVTVEDWYPRESHGKDVDAGR